MNITKITNNGMDIAIVSSPEILITDIQSALDFIGTVNFEAQCDRVILNKTAISEDFFNLKTRLAGEIIQKFVNYHMKIAIVGDFSLYTSQSLKEFIFESNHGKDIFFLSNEQQAVDKLSLLDARTM